MLDCSMPRDSVGYERKNALAPAVASDHSTRNETIRMLAADLASRQKPRLSPNPLETLLDLSLERVTGVQNR